MPKEYIDREALKNRLKTLPKRITPIEDSRDMFYHDSGRNGAIIGALLEVEKAPAADVAPVVHGEWIEHERYSECNLCHTKTIYSHKYCPNCGAKMDGERRE